MTGNIIDLLSSDDEEPQEASASLASRKKPASPAAKNSTETIDLCDSSDDEDTATNHKTAATQPSRKQPKSLSSSSSSSSLFPSIKLYSDDDDDDLLNEGPVFRKSTGSTDRVPVLGGIHSHSTAVRPSRRTSLSKTMTTLSSAKTATPSLSTDKAEGANMKYPDSDSDNEILNFTSGLTSKRIDTPAKKAPMTNPSGGKSPPKEYFATNTTSVTKIVNPYMKSVPATAGSRVANQEQALTPFPYPKLTENSKQYPDERARFLLAFWKFGKSQVSHSFQRPKLDSTAKKILKLALTQYPIRSVEELASRGSSHSSVADLVKTRDALRRDLETGELNRFKTDFRQGPKRQFHSIVEACLVALLENAERAVLGVEENLPEVLSKRTFWMPLCTLIPAIDERLLAICPGKLTRTNEHDNGAAHYSAQSTRSIEFLQIAKLECTNGDNGPYIKRRSVNKQIQFELLPDGFDMARHVRNRSFPAQPGHYRSSKILSLQQVDTARYANICLGVDSREGGGGSKTLHQMCNKLEMMLCPYFVGSLSIGDYVFFTNKNGAGNEMNHLCPILVERKSVQDVAQSIHDGRWQRQKHRMYVGQHVFGYGNSRMVYIIEGNEDKQTVSGGFVGARWFEVNKEKLSEEINNLEEEGFDVLRTTSVENSMFELARWVQKISAEMKAGTMKAQFTYAEFKQKVAEIPRQTDFSRIAKYYKKERSKLAQSQSSLTDSGHPTSPKNRPSLPSEKPAAKKRKSSVVDEDDSYAGWSKNALANECQAAGLAKSGSIAELLARLKGPRPPPAWLKRKAAKEYVPQSYNVGSTALLVALFLHETEVGETRAGISKDDLYVKAESLEITKNPFSGGGRRKRDRIITMDGPI